MKRDYAMQWFVLAGKCLGVLALLGFIGGIIFDATVLHDNPLLIGFFCALAAVLYAAVPVGVFVSFIVALRAIRPIGDAK
jgi:hypothetical protein